MSSILDTVGGTTFITGFQGQLNGDANDAIIETRINENATAIDFGAPVQRGVAVAPGGPPGNCKPVATSGTYIGISVRLISEANAQTVNSSTVNYPQYHEVPILKRGWIWVKAVEAVTEGDQALAIVASQSGMGGTTGGASSSARLLPENGDARWQQTVGSGAVGLLSVNMA